MAGGPSRAAMRGRTRERSGQFSARSSGRPPKKHTATRKAATDAERGRDRPRKEPLSKSSDPSNARGDYNVGEKAKRALEHAVKLVLAGV